MTISAQSVVRDAVTELQDPTNVRWPVAELCRYLNDGQREIAMYRPDAMVMNASVPLVAGTKQTLPAGGVKLLDFRCNTGGNKRAVRMVNREILDAQVPGWHALTGVTEILHFMYDVRDPRVFYVYPPAAGSGSPSLDGTYATNPTDITVPAEGAAVTDVSGNISVPDIHANALRDYILYRAYNKDAEYASDPTRAMAHYQAFANALGIEIKSASMAAPTSAANPNSQATPIAAA
jgi:hypothetical protein